jgi:hypothetical protein
MAELSIWLAYVSIWFSRELNRLSSVSLGNNMTEGMHACSIKNNLVVWNLKSKNFFKAKISRQINDIRDTGPDTENTDHGPDMGFYGPLVNQSE